MDLFKSLFVFLTITSILSTLAFGQQQSVVTTSGSQPPNQFGMQANQEEYTMMSGPKHSIMLRAPRSIGNFFRRMMGKSDKTANSGLSSQMTLPPGLQGYIDQQGAIQAAQQQAVYAAAPAYAVPAGYVPQPVAAYPGVAAAPSIPQATYMPASGPMAAYAQMPAGYAAAASNPYASYAMAPPSSGSPDFHAVLDNFVRSSGLTPAGSIPGDQEAAASSFVKTGDTPVFSFKKLYSFPFYLSSDNAPGFALNIPYMKRHIRRMSSSPKTSTSSPSSSGISSLTKAVNLNSLKSMRQMQHDQQKLMKALHSSEMIANYLQSYLRKQDQQQAAIGSSINSIHEKPSMMMSMPPMMMPPPMAYTSSPGYASKISNTVRQQQHRVPQPESIPRTRASAQEPRQPQPEPVRPEPEPSAAQSYLSNYYAHPAANSDQYYTWNPESAGGPSSTQDQIYQRLAQLEDLRRRRSQAMNSVSAADDLLSDQLNSRVVVDESMQQQQQPSSPSRSSGPSSSSLHDSLSELQSLSNGLRSMSAPSLVLPEADQRQQQQGYSEDLLQEGNLSAQESSYRPSVVTYYADPAVSSSMEEAGGSKMRASVTDVMGGTSSSSSSISKRTSVSDSGRSVQLSSSFSMGSASPPS